MPNLENMDSRLAALAQDVKTLREKCENLEKWRFLLGAVGIAAVIGVWIVFGIDPKVVAKDTAKDVAKKVAEDEAKIYAREAVIDNVRDEVRKKVDVILSETVTDIVKKSKPEIEATAAKVADSYARLVVEGTVPEIVRKTAPDIVKGHVMSLVSAQVPEEVKRLVREEASEKTLQRIEDSRKEAADSAGLAAGFAHEAETIVVKLRERAKGNREVQVKRIPLVVGVTEEAMEASRSKAGFYIFPKVHGDIGSPEQIAATNRNFLRVTNTDGSELSFPNKRIEAVMVIPTVRHTDWTKMWQLVADVDEANGNQILLRAIGFTGPNALTKERDISVFADLIVLYSE